MGFKTINGKKVFIDNDKPRIRHVDPDVVGKGLKIGSGTRVPKFVAVRDEDGDIDVFDKTNLDRIEEIIEVEAERRIEDFSLDDYEEVLNELEPQVESGGVSEPAGSFQRRNDITAFRGGKNDYADGQRDEFQSQVRNEIDEEESLKENKFVK